MDALGANQFGSLKCWAANELAKSRFFVRVCAMKSLALTFVLSLTVLTGMAAEPDAANSAGSPKASQMPPPLVPGATVVPLWPAGSPTLKNFDEQEAVTTAKGHPETIIRVTNINNPSIELHLAPADKANGVAMIVAAGGGNKELWVGPEGVEVANWLNSMGVSAFVLRYRLQPYTSAGDALADTQRSIRLIRARAKEWNVDASKVGVMGFSAGGEQAARVALNYDKGNTESADAVEKQSDRPDFVVLVYAGWRELDLSHVPKDAPPAFLTSAGVDDAFHAKETVDFYNAYFNAKIPVELHIYGHGKHGGSIQTRNGIPFGTWQYRFVDWFADLGMMKK
ncbi:MAG: axeA1 3 [Pedosphaera sp.]|nr:axeA1 3 [Pedosphaera sp.]